MKKNIYLLSLFFLIGCQSKKVLDNNTLTKKISFCIAERVKNDPLYEEGFNLKLFLKKVETLMINNNLLSGKKKRDYIKLLNNIEVKSFKNRDIGQFIGEIKAVKNYKLLEYSLNINNTSFECNRFLIENNKLQFEGEFSAFYNVLTQYFKQGSVKDNLELNTKMIQSLSDRMFENITYRLPIICIAYENVILISETN